MSSSDAHQKWTNCWLKYYEKAEDLEMLRRIDEEYEAKILQYTEKDLGRVQKVDSPHATVQPLTSESAILPYLMLRSDPRKHSGAWNQTKFEHMVLKGGEPRICLGTGYLIALVPPAAQPGDLVVRFWNCDAAVVIRSTAYNRVSGLSTSFKLVGRADVAEVVDRAATPGDDPHAKRCMLASVGSSFGNRSPIYGAVTIKLNFRTLQIISAHITT